MVAQTSLRSIGPPSVCPPQSSHVPFAQVMGDPCAWSCCSSPSAFALSLLERWAASWRPDHPFCLGRAGDACVLGAAERVGNTLYGARVYVELGRRLAHAHTVRQSRRPSRALPDYRLLR